MVTRPPLKMVGEDGNAFAILGAAMLAARAAGWSQDEWAEVRDRAMSGDYCNLLNVIGEVFDVE